MQVPDKWWDKFKDKKIKMRNRDPRRENLGHLRCALAMCENIDWNVGRILKKIDDLNVRDNTIVVFFHDNGPNGVRWNDNMKGRKGSTDEGGVRSPLLIRWPDQIPKGSLVNPIASAMDLLPTLADCANIPLITKKPLDGKSLKPLLLDKSLDWQERTLINYWKGTVSARNQRYRLDNFGKLFDMVKDPEQQIDISRTQPKIAKKLLNEVSEWKKNVKKLSLDKNLNWKLAKVIDVKKLTLKIETEDKVEGLIKYKDISWTKKELDKIFKKGDVVLSLIHI